MSNSKNRRNTPVGVKASKVITDTFREFCNRDCDRDKLIFAMAFALGELIGAESIASGKFTIEEIRKAHTPELIQFYMAEHLH